MVPAWVLLIWGLLTRVLVTDKVLEIIGALRELDIGIIAAYAIHNHGR